MFFPPLPYSIEDEGPRLQRAPVKMPAITMEEVELRGTTCVEVAKLDPVQSLGGIGFTLAET